MGSHILYKALLKIVDTQPLSTFVTMNYRLDGAPDRPPAYDEVVQTPPGGLEQDEAQRVGETARFLQSVPEETGSELQDDEEDDLIVDQGEERELRQEMEQFEIFDDGESSSMYQRASEASQRIAQKLKSHLIYPMRQILIDPVARTWVILNSKIEAVLLRFGNPLMFKRLFYLFCVALTIFIAVTIGLVPDSTSGLRFSEQFHSPNDIRAFLNEAVSVDLMRESYSYMTSMAHMAGTAGDLTLAKYIESQFGKFGFDSRRIEFNEQKTFLSFPNTTESAMEFNLLGDKPYRAKMWEGKVYEHPAGSQQQTRPFLPLSVQGEAEGHLIYANYGSVEDFAYLDAHKIDLNGAIVMMRYGKLAAGLKAMQAEMRGAKGVVFFSEKVTDDLSWPDGPDYPYDAFQRESVAVPAIVPGDILTPGWSSSDSSRTIKYESARNIPHIPAIPISWHEVRPFLEALKGHGEKVDNWSNKAPAVDEWWTGNVDSPKAYLKNWPVLQERHSIWNVLAKIYGMEQPEKAVIIGAPRDSFCYGGVEPTTGTVVMLEIARLLSYMNRKLGWMPLRSIFFASWDGSKQNFVGSTEWVENNLEDLRRDGLVYINLNDAVSGKDFHAYGHPIFSQAVKKILDGVADPAFSNNSTLGNRWNSGIESMDGNGDYLSFLSHAGIPSVDIKFTGERFPRHSCFDSAERMRRFVDGDFKYHQALVEIVADLVVRFADEPIAPFDLANYGSVTHDLVRDLESYAKVQPGWKDGFLDFNILQYVSDALMQSGVVFQQWEQGWLESVKAGGEPPILGIHRQSWNSRLANLDKNMLYRDLHDRMWYNHVIFGPQLWHPVEGDYEWFSFPLIRDLIQQQKWSKAQEMINHIGGIAREAAVKFIS